MRAHQRVLFILIASAPAWVRGETPVLSAEEIIERLVARSKVVAGQTEGHWHSCRRVTVVEELDDKGGIAKRKTREQQVVSTNGVETVRLIRSQEGTTAGDDAEGGEGERKDRGDRKKESGRKGEKKSQTIDEEILRRFNYTQAGEEMVGGRRNHVLVFTPKPVKADADISDRLVGLLNGRIWVDATEFELTRVDAHLSRTFEVLGGIAASIQRLDLAIERVPLPDGSWETGKMQTEIQGRKMFSSLRSRYRMEQDGFETGTVLPARGAGGGQP